MTAQPALQHRLRRYNDECSWLDILAVGAIAAGFLAVFAELRFEAQAVDRTKIFVALVEAEQAELGGTISPAAGIADDRLHLRQQVGAHGVVGLLRGFVGFVVIKL